jgi:RNA polymerase sigma-70 factor (ECF subfamily)
VNAVLSSRAVGARPRGAERPSFAAVAEEELDSVFRYLLFLTGSHALAEDLTGDTFERALRAWRRYDPRRGSPRTWLCQIARSTALDHFRADERRRRREQSYAAREDGELLDAGLGGGLSPALEDAVRSLAAGDREVLALRVVLDLDGPTAARVLGISTTACSTRLSRALQRLEERMESNAVA